jgi:alpha-tubulin suppressor-like RCC1 family protein
VIPYLSNIIKTSTGYYHTLVLDRDGFVFSFGVNQVTSKLIEGWPIRT